VTWASIKYFLLLSFLLAYLPSQKAQQQNAAKARTFVVVVDHVASLAATEIAQKIADKESEDSHPLAYCDVLLPNAPVERIQHFSSPVIAYTAAYYPIRAPPFQA
jgi:hypothetical protein